MERFQALDATRLVIFIDLRATPASPRSQANRRLHANSFRVARLSRANEICYSNEWKNIFPTSKAGGPRKPTGHPVLSKTGIIFFQSGGLCSLSKIGTFGQPRGFPVCSGFSTRFEHLPKACRSDIGYRFSRPALQPRRFRCLKRCSRRRHPRIFRYREIWW